MNDKLPEHVCATCVQFNDWSCGITRARVLASAGDRCSRYEPISAMDGYAPDRAEAGIALDSAFETLCDAISAYRKSMNSVRYGRSLGYSINSIAYLREAVILKRAEFLRARAEYIGALQRAEAHRVGDSIPPLEGEVRVESALNILRDLGVFQLGDK